MSITAIGIAVSIYAQAYEQIANWIDLAGDIEVSGLGLVEEERDEDGRLAGYLVTDVFLPKQTNGPTSTELDPESVAQLMLELEQKEDGASNRLRFWWHYHPGGIGLMWSATDDECVDELHNGGWFLATVFTSDMNCRTRLDLYEPVRVTIDDIETRVRYTDFGLRHECEELYRERVVRKPIGRNGLLGRGPGSLLSFDQFDMPSPRRDVTAEELLIAQEEMEAGLMGYSEYAALYESACLDGMDPLDGVEEERCATGGSKTS